MANKLSFLFLGFGSFYMLVRCMPKSEFGIWALFVSITTLIETGRNGLIQNALIKALVDPNNSKSEVMSASISINVLLTLGFVLVYLGLYQWLPFPQEYAAMKPMMLFYCITTLALLPLSQCNFIQQGNFDFKGIFFTSILRQGSFFLVVLYYYLSEKPFDLVTLVNYQSGAVILGAICALLFCRGYIEVAWPVNRKLVSTLFHYGKYTMGTNISSMLFKSIDQLMLGWMMHPAAVAIYNAAVRVNNLVEYPASAMVEILFPKSAQKASQEGILAVEKLYHTSLAYMLALFVPAVVLIELFAHPLIMLAAGKEYEESVNILRLVTLAGIVVPFTRQFGLVMDSTGHPHLNFRMLIVNVCINTILNLFFIRWMGVMGAAIGTTLSFLLNGILSQIVLSRVINVNYKTLFLLYLEANKQSFHQIRKRVKFL